METESHSGHRAARLHVGGKLSFRRRVRKGDEDPDLELPLVELSEDPPTLEELVPEGFEEVEIEVGPGKGTFMVAATEARPETFVLGIEAAPSYAHHTAEKLARAERENALVLIDNAKLYIQDRVGEAALARLHVYFVDPWPKRRHRRRRFFTPDIVPHIERVVRPGGYLLVATDNPAYAGQIAAVLGNAQGLERDLEEEARLRAGGPGHGFSPTSFEAKYIKEGRIIRRYAFRVLG